jgi:hypothetical protein
MNFWFYLILIKLKTYMTYMVKNRLENAVIYNIEQYGSIDRISIIILSMKNESGTLWLLHFLNMKS